MESISFQWYIFTTVKINCTFLIKLSTRLLVDRGETWARVYPRALSPADSQ